MIKSFLNSEGHQNPINGSKVMAILLKGWIWPIGEASAGQGLRLQPAQQAYLFSLCFYSKKIYIELSVIDNCFV